MARGRKAYMILVASQKGGVGKTTFALNLAAALRARGYSVLLVDSDTESASASEHLGMEVGGRGFEEALKGRVKIDDILFTYTPLNLDILPASPSEEVVEVGAGAYRRLFAMVSRLEYDFIVVDSPPGLFTREIIDNFNEVAILTTPDYVTAKGSAKMARYCERCKLPHRLIINRLGYSRYDLNIGSIERLYGDLAFDVIPEDRTIARSMANREPAYVTSRHSQFSRAVDGFARAYALRVGGGGNADAEEEPEPTSLFGRLRRRLYQRIHPQHAAAAPEVSRKKGRA